MSKILLPATRTVFPPWNKGQLISQKRPLPPRQVWTIRTRRERAGILRAVQLLLGHSKVDSVVRYLDVEGDDALSSAEKIDM